MKKVSDAELSVNPFFDNHESVFEFEDQTVGLHGFVAIHNSNLGPAVGGTRMFPYHSREGALNDVLRLSRAMTYKCAIAGVWQGGGKAVIIADPRSQKTESLIRRYAQCIGELQGAFYTGEDVGISEQDVQVMLEESPYFIGKSGAAGDPSPYASLSCYTTMKTVAENIWGDDRLKGKTVVVKGVGKVGCELVRLLLQEGANLVVADIDRKIIQKLIGQYPEVRAVDPEKAIDEPVDIFSPCALGNEITETTKTRVRARLICGGANNQLSSPEVGDWLFENQILYVPDYMANAGGLINVADELEEGGYQKERVLNRIELLKGTLRTVLSISSSKHRGAHRIADEIAEKLFQKT